MALGQSADILFKIKADTDQAQARIGAFKRDLKGLEDAEKDQLAPLQNIAALTGVSANSFNVAAQAATVFTRVLAAQLTAIAGAVTGLFALAKVASDAGSELYDAQAKTGLTAATLSTLKLAADSAGSSFDGVTTSVAKLNVLIGQANLGNEKAIATLDQYGIKSRDLNGALEEAIKLINDEADETKQAAAAKDLFKDKTGSVLPIIKQLGGDLKNAEKEAERLGTTLTESDIQAADNFGDTLTQLTSQVKVAAERFALTFAPAITSAMAAVSSALANNQDIARIWGQSLYDVMWTVQKAWTAGGNAISGILDFIGIKFTRSADTARIWAEAILAAINPVLAIASRLGAIFNKDAGAGMGGQFNPDAGIPSVVAGGNGGGTGKGGGGGPSGPSDLDKAKDANAEYLKDVKQTVAEALSENERLFAEKLRLEEDFIDEKNRMNQFEIIEEIRVTKELLLIASITADERIQIEREVARLESQLRTEQNKQEKQAAEDRVDAIEQAAKEIVEWEEWLEKKRKEIRDRERKKANDGAKTELTDSEKEAIRLKNESNLSILGDSVLSIRNGAGNLENTFKPILPVLQLAGQALNQFAQGIGNVVQNFILMGSAGPNAMKKLVASVLAGVSAQAAVISIMELAYGIAALTPWGLAIYGNPANHFKASALMAAVAVGTGVIGRGVAGNSFQDGGSAGGSGSGSDANAGNRPGLVFTTAFKGFEEKVSAAMDGVSDAVNRFNQKFGIASPSDVVMAGAGGASSAIFSATLDAVQNDGSLAIEFQRKIGNY